MNQLGKARDFTCFTEINQQHGQFQIAALFVAVLGYADAGRLERGNPSDFFDAFLNQLTVGCCRRTVFNQKFLGNALIDQSSGRQIESGDQIATDEPGIANYIHAANSPLTSPPLPGNTTR